MGKRIKNKEYILCAAIKREVPRDIPNVYFDNDLWNIEIGYRHVDILRRFPNEVSKHPKDQGFYTSKGRFVNRRDAMQIAYNANQVSKEKAFLKINDDVFINQLFSEDLY